MYPPFSASEPKVQVHFCDHALSVVINFSHFRLLLCNSTKLDRKQEFNILYQVCVFRADRKTKMAALPSYWLRHFRLLFCNRWTEINETWGNKILISSTEGVLFGLIRKVRWSLQPLIGWDIFYFFSATAEWNSTKLDRKQVLSILHQICVFRADHYQHVFHFKKRYSGAWLWPFAFWRLYMYVQFRLWVCV